MKKTFLVTLLLALLCAAAGAQPRPTVAIFGDSYSTFEGFLTPDTMETWYYASRADARRTDVTSVSQTWWMQLITRRGWKLGVNNSWSGATICCTGYGDADYTYKSFLTRVPALGSPDIILLFGGTNDSWAGSPIGSFQYEGWRRADLYAFRPAMACLLARLQERYPTAALYAICNDGLSQAVTESMAEICRHYKVPVIQLHGIDKTAGHPNVKGMGQIAEQVDRAIKAW